MMVANKSLRIELKESSLFFVGVFRGEGTQDAPVDLAVCSASEKGFGNDDAIRICVENLNCFYSR